MNNSAEQIHQGKLNMNPKKSREKKLFIDLDVCSTGKCEKCVIQCSYLYHPNNIGIVSVAELATYALVCRRCEEPHCVNACPVEALEQQKDKNKLLIRHNMRCVSCKSCSHACPYGTIYPENVPFLIHNCDFCLDRREEKKGPLCIKSCSYGALSLKEGDIELGENTFLVGDNLIVHSTHWNREKGMIYLLYLIVFGFLLTAVIGLIASWIDRKVTARVQYRVGPPLLQPLIDIIKLLGKETLVPEGVSKATFLMAPVIGFSSVVLVSTILWINNIDPTKSFVGDLIVVLYLLVVPSISIIMGGFASKNPFASLGASREMKLVMGYELPFILAVLVPVMHAHSIRLGDILNYQANNGIFIGSWSGFLAWVVVILCMQAKMALVPFDMSEAETEIIGGPLIEYSGSGLAMYRLMKNMMLFTLPFFVMILFMGGLKFDGIHFLNGALKYIGLVALITVIRNTNPRVRIDQAVKFFWGPVTVVGIIAVVLAFLGK